MMAVDYPTILTPGDWNRKKGVFAKMAGKTGVGEALTGLFADFKDLNQKRFTPEGYGKISSLKEWENAKKKAADFFNTQVAKLQGGTSYIRSLPDEVVRYMRGRHFEATERFDRLREADAILICVPTPLTEAREPDLTYIVNSARAVAAKLRAGQLIVLEST